MPPKPRPAFWQLTSWYLRRLSRLEALEAKIRDDAGLRRHHALQRTLADGLRSLRELMTLGFGKDDIVPEDMILPHGFWEDLA